MEIPTAAILKNPDLYEKVKNDLRYSDDGMSRNEAQEYERTRDEQNRADIDAAASAMRTVQEAGEKAERIRDGLRTQFEALGHKKVGKREAEFYSTIWTAAIANEARYAGVDIEEMARRWNLRFQYDRGTGDVRRMRGVYSQPINEGVDPKAEVGIVDVDLGQYTAAQLSTPQELLQYIKSLIGKESMLSRDSKALLGISSNSNAKHLVRSAKPTDTFKEQDARNAALLSIEDIVKNSVLIESFPNRNSKKKHLKNVHRLYVPLRIGDELHTLRVVAHETQDKSGLVPIRADLFDLIVEKESSRPSSDSLSGSTLSSAPPVPTKTGVSTVTIADMLRGVKDAEGRPYVGEEYRQSSARQSEEYDPGDPKTWPAGPARDEALELEAWQNLENDDEPETWPESPEKTEALALRKEYGEIEAWVESHTVEEVLANDELNERGVAIEKRLRDLRKELRKKKPKGAERRLLQLIEAEEEAAAQEAETYYQSAYQRQAEEKLARDEKAWAETIDSFMAGKLIHNRQVRVMTTPIALILAADEGSGFKEIVTTPRILNKILKQKHVDVTPEILKQLPRAMADPILVFKSATVPGSYVSMLELKDSTGGTVVVPVALNASAPGKQAFMTSVYGKGNITQANNQWFAEQIESGNLRYINTKKSASWARDVGLQLPIMSLPAEALHELNIPTEADLVKARGENPGYYQRQAEEKLAQDEKTWATLIDRFLDNNLSGREKGAPLPVMTTPLVLSLTGVEVLPVEIHARNLDKILNGKHEIAPETLKQIPRAIADPIMIFRSPADESKGRDSRVILTELTEKDTDGKDRSIVAAITLERANTRYGYEINELTTVFRKDVSSKQNMTPELDVLDWMTRRHKDGSPMNLLLYLNRNKGLEWLDRTGTSPKASSLFQDPYVQSVPNEADLDNLRASAPGFYQDAGTPLGSTRFGEAETIVTILKDGNRSTFLHELGHVFLNSRKNLALMEGIDETIRQDWTKLVEWLEVADIDFSKPLSEADEKRWRNAHEKFATGFEKYLMEGKAPSLELARAFRAFRKWLTDIYRAARNIFYVDADGNRVEFEINDEIRGVMDRMLASEEEIEASRGVREAERLAHILTEQGIPDEVAEHYRDVIAEGADAARAKLMTKLSAELKAEKQAELKEARKQAKKQAGTEVWDLPEYRALKALLTPRDKGGLRLSMPELIALYGDAGAEALARELPVGVTANDGLSLAEAAELLGYGTPDELLEDLKRAKNLPPQQAVADRVRTATAQLESSGRSWATSTSPPRRLWPRDAACPWTCWPRLLGWTRTSAKLIYRE